MDHGVRYAGRLSQQTFRTFLQFLRDTAVLDGRVSFARFMVSRLPTLLPTDLTAYHELTPTTFRTIWTGAPACGVAASAVHVLEQYPDHQPCAARHSEGDDERLLDFADFLSWRQFSTLKIYQDFYRLMGIRYQVMLGLHASQSQLVGIVVSRSLRPFSAHDRFLLRMLRPQLIQAYRSAEAVSRLRREQARTGELVDTLGIEIMVLGRDARVRSASERAWRWVADYFADVPLDGDPRGPNCLPATLDRWVRAEQILRSNEWPARQGHEIRSECLAVRQNGKRLVVRLCSDKDERLLVLHEEPHSANDDDHQADLREKFGLTMREAEVLTWVIHGKTNAEIGRILRIRPRTVSKHLEHVFPRLGVETRTGAIARVLSSVSAS